jgi:hypothetical protein
MRDLRAELGDAGRQEHLNRRLRDLDPTHVITRVRRGRETIYRLLGERDEPLDTTPISGATRARILWRDHRCQMCGRDVEHDGVRLHVDHRIPRDLGGESDDSNLWALCSACNQGKRAFFATLDDPAVLRALVHGSIHVRIGELLKAKGVGTPVSKSDIKIVAYTHEDWEKRLRELRVLGWDYHTVRQTRDGRVRPDYVLDHWEPWPDDPAREIRAAEAAARRGDD